MSKQLARWFADLCKGISHHHNDDELKRLCADLNMDYEEFKGMSPQDASLEIGGAVIFRNQVDKLLNYMRKNRPRVQPFSYQELNWDSIGSQAKISMGIGDPLLAFLGSQPVTVPKSGEYRLWYHELIKALTSYYSEDEFRQMCLDLSINYARLQGMKMSDKAQEVVRIAISSNAIGRLVKYCRSNRPRVQPMSNHDIPWDDIVQRSAAAFKEKNPLHDPILAKRIKAS
ncbi:MAG: hypothetical protein ACI9EW_001723 [Cellvibrionaceae bacterium]|jgi:hypothetical protein